jgi:cytochrome c-type biogenesis protein CcmF
MDYIGEHLLPGKIGHLLIIVSLTASLIAAFSYYRSFRSAGSEDQAAWKKLGRIAFFIDALCVIGVFILLYALIAGHRYEYMYVYKNSGNDLEPKYIFSSLWSASEGSFILWTLWHAILGIVLMFTSKKWEGPAMMILSVAQACLATMLLGIYVSGEKIGVSPFALFREHMPDLPVFAYADYAQRIKDGNGLNQLLQNYWMVIHPPVLFLGFASTIIPFCFALGGLMTKKYGDWIKPALPWALFSAATLGIGVMMGAAWAYESLSFGGYWAWDPVENASLVPWLVLVAAIHTMLIYKHTGRSLRASHLLTVLTFILIVYSTFLTRSGILGDTSVHSFADTGINKQLYLFLYVFFWIPAIVSANGIRNQMMTLAAGLVLIPLTAYVHPVFALLAPLTAIVLLMVNLNRAIPAHRKEEAASSREFWMFIGSLVVFFSAVLIILQTSVPVFNKIFGTKRAPPEDVEFSYNRIQVFIAVIIGLLTAVTQYLKYKETSSGFFLKRIGLPFALSAAAASLILSFGNINYDKYGPGYLAAIWAAVASSVFAVIANLSYIWLGVKGSLRLSGPSVAHFGFGLMLLGILISSSKKEVLSYNTTGIPVNFGPDSKEKTGENLTLVKGLKTDMGKYTVTYAGDYMHPKKSRKYFTINFEEKSSGEKFTLTPDAFINYQGNEGLMANPDAKHYWDHDVFAYITALADPSKNQDTSSFKNYTASAGDSVSYGRGFIILEELIARDSLPAEIFGKDGKLYEAKLKIHSKTNSTYSASPKLAVKNGYMLSVPDTIMGESLIVQLSRVNGASAELGIKKSDAVLDFLTLKVYRFPFINILWLGTVLMAIGFIISMVRRMQRNKTSG